MSATGTVHRTCRSPEDTRALGRALGRLIRTPGVLALFGDLGSGKTVWVQGLAEGLEVPDAYVVTSPSYTLINQYPGRLDLYHVDLYRLEDDADFEAVGLYDLLDGDGVVAIEWAERIAADLPEARIEIRMETGPENVRDIRIRAYGLPWGNLVRRLENFPG